MFNDNAITEKSSEYNCNKIFDTFKERYCFPPYFLLYTQKVVHYILISLILF